MNRSLLPVLAALLTGAFTAGLALADDDDDDQGNRSAYSIGMWGDVPYSADVAREVVGTWS